MADIPGETRRSYDKWQSTPQRLIEHNRPLACSDTFGILPHINVECKLLSFSSFSQEALYKYFFHLKRKTWQEQTCCWVTFINWDCDTGCSLTTGAIFKLHKNPRSPLRESPARTAGYGRQIFTSISSGQSTLGHSTVLVSDKFCTTAIRAEHAVPAAMINTSLEQSKTIS